MMGRVGGVELWRLKEMRRWRPEGSRWRGGRKRLTYGNRCEEEEA
jgi:hypothetical protein